METTSYPMASLPTKIPFSALFILLVFSSFFLFGIQGAAQREFDYFALALQWPGTYCQRTHHCCSSNACCRGSNSPTGFTIHGLWPDYNDGTWPACCRRSSFNMTEISSFLGVLQKYWPSLSCGSPSTCFGGRGLFWAHEWEKHGTCSFPVIRDEYSYFLTALNLYFKYNVTGIMNDAGYVASNSEKYPSGSIISAIENAVGASPLLVCSHGAVKEISLCFDKDLKPRDCIIDSASHADLLASRSSCPKYISLPEYVPLSKSFDPILLLFYFNICYF
ncbi:ribonuclease 2 isoform X1 [Macadamia integrifolia]|uniref:ribonuclease 2 isoform X1 n=1 Tax=Macadamia integrifolia TaxID=60698 RepID=UPI001C4E6DAD|nr:ribonuclease 2 isoform X1 [Macadamia integrifolia]